MITHFKTSHVQLKRKKKKMGRIDAHKKVWVEWKEKEFKVSICCNHSRHCETTCAGKEDGEVKRHLSNYLQIIVRTTLMRPKDISLLMSQQNSWE